MTKQDYIVTVTDAVTQSTDNYHAGKSWELALMATLLFVFVQVLIMRASIKKHHEED